MNTSRATWSIGKLRPSRGPHSVVPAPCGLHDKEIPEENMVHTLEHGVIGILFDPRAERDQVRRIEAFVGKASHPMFSAPFHGLESNIAVIAWTRLLPLDDFDVDTVEEFARGFASKAPQGMVGCSRLETNSFLRAS